jgi:8-oxo-dGTP pyrophosphatase MutT (NUDIX family)
MSAIPAATVILVREGAAGLEVFLVKRHRKSSFMSSAFVFPGGKVDAADGTAETAAIRELFEEAGVLLASPPGAAAGAAAARARLLGGEVSFADLCIGCGLTLDSSRLHWWARWITPPQEPRRFDAEFFVAELPPDQSPSYDRKETVEELWITPAHALEKQAAGELRLAPPQLRTFHELSAAGGTVASVIAAAAVRQRRRIPICPRLAQEDDGLAIILPWDPAYSDDGPAIPPDDVLATPPSRFVWSGTAWRAM